MSLILRLLTLCAMFIRRGSARLKELAKVAAGMEHTRIPELLDHKCHVTPPILTHLQILVLQTKLSEIAVSLLKLAPYDPSTLACTGLRQYFTYVMPIVDWSVETNRHAIHKEKKQFYQFPALPLT